MPPFNIISRGPLHNCSFKEKTPNSANKLANWIICYHWQTLKISNENLVSQQIAINCGSTLYVGMAHPAPHTNTYKLPDNISTNPTSGGSQ